MRRAAALIILLALRCMGCGTERWAVKVGLDAGAVAVDTLHPLSSSVASMIRLKAPRHPPETARVPETEKTVFAVQGYIQAFKLEADQDIHVVLGDSAGHTMVIEFPDSACLRMSPFEGAARTARNSLFALVGKPTPKLKKLAQPIKVLVTGVGFFDKIHGQAGVAPNGIELHPVLSLEAIRNP